MSEEAVEENAEEQTESTGQTDDTDANAGDTVDGGNASANDEGAPADEGASFDWRKEIAGDDEKFIKKLERYSTAADFAKAHQELQKRISEGFKAPELPENATEEQIKEYREKIGVPESASDYALNLPEGMTVGEADKPLWDSFLAEANNLNLTQSELDKVAPAYYAMEQKLREQQDADVKARMKENETALRDDWGSDYSDNININENFLTKFGGDELKEKLMYGYDANGAPLSNDPTVAKFLNQVARMNGFSDGMAYNDESSAVNIQERIDAIKSKRTGENRNAYYKNSDQVAKDDKELNELYAMRDKIKNTG